jgi:hypothetical protein
MLHRRGPRPPCSKPAATAAASYGTTAAGLCPFQAALCREGFRWRPLTAVCGGGIFTKHIPPKYKAPPGFIFWGVSQLAFNSNPINFRTAKFKHSNLGPKFALKMGPKFALTDIFQNKIGRGYLLMNLKKSEVCTLGYVPSPNFSSV